MNGSWVGAGHQMVGPYRPAGGDLSGSETKVQIQDRDPVLEYLDNFPGAPLSLWTEQGIYDCVGIQQEWFPAGGDVWFCDTWLQLKARA
ncbi:hypothetical protein BH772_gp007 [Gordonia phage Bachita]|uniref:Uncharacterized protein n=1 Tax=Gordonia phage Bachita TaxID=1838061 RepID=A0A160DFK7_9CAUD|nr:hypothetical protein BH772_gp007 [Gordonia phage Bachita]ANA86692.1 hypothetical protein PBI_BACHITA_7 [Gordonia phage Bachita]WKW85812.1 hypothetical protein SEA_PHINKBODEN_7 [Gordonia Phage PhinkBoden]